MILCTLSYWQCIEETEDCTQTVTLSLKGQQIYLAQRALPTSLMQARDTLFAECVATIQKHRGAVRLRKALKAHTAEETGTILVFGRQKFLADFSKEGLGFHTLQSFQWWLGI